MTVITHTHFVQTPGIEALPNNFIIQQLIRERIRAVIMGENGVDFKLLASTWVMKYIKAPEFQDDEKGEKYQAWFKKEGDMVYDHFVKYEENVTYQDSIKMLRQYEGWMFNISSVTFSGVMVLLTDPDGKTVNGI